MVIAIKQIATTAASIIAISRLASTFNALPFVVKHKSLWHELKFPILPPFHFKINILRLSQQACCILLLGVIML